jgi:hypothetical protein
MFDPSVGRWFEEDPQGFAAGDPNLFRDVTNNPTNATDPSGLAPEPAPAPHLPVPTVQLGTGVTTGYAGNGWITDGDIGKVSKNWEFMIPKVSFSTFPPGKVGYGFNLIVRPPEVKDKQSVILNRIDELGIFDATTPGIGPIITKDKEGTMDTEITGDTIFSVDVGGDLGSFKLDKLARSPNRDIQQIVPSPPNAAGLPALQKFTGAGDNPARKLFPAPATDITGTACTKTEVAGKTANADWIVWIQRVTKTFGFVEGIKADTGQHILSGQGYVQYLGEITVNFNRPKNPAPAVKIQYTYLFVNQTKTATIPETMKEDFIKRLESEIKLPASDIKLIKELIANKKVPPKAPVQRILLDNPRNTNDPIILLSR